MKIKNHRRFEKEVKTLLKGQKISFIERVNLFIVNPFDPLLNYHHLRGRFEGFQSIDITGDIRLILRYAPGEDTVLFYRIGTHSYLYKK